MSWTTARARIAAHARNHPDRPVPPELYGDLRAAKAEDYLRELVAADPPISDDQRRKLRAMLAPTR